MAEGRGDWFRVLDENATLPTVPNARNIIGGNTQQDSRVGMTKHKVTYDATTGMEIATRVLCSVSVLER